MMMDIIDSASGDVLGYVNILGMDDEAILAYLCRTGYLDGSPDDYEMTRSYPFAEGELIVLDAECGTPVLAVTIPEEKAA